MFGFKIRKKVLVVGGEGFIGRHLVDTGEFEFTTLDLKKNQDARDGISGNWDVIVFLAVDQSPTDEAISYNEDLYLALDDYMALHPETQVIYPSSAAVYPDSPTPQEELVIPNPPSKYGVSKLLGEVYVQQYRNHTILRLANVYSGGDGNGVVDQFLRGEKPKGNPNCVRDYIHVDLVVEAILSAIYEPKTWFGITNISSNHGQTVREIWESIRGDEPFKSSRSRKGDVKCSILDNTRLTRLLGEDND